MGLNVVAGFIGELLDDHEGAEWHREAIAAANKLLAAHRLPRFLENEAARPLDVRIGPYTWLHYLRRLGAHLALNGKLPPPGDENGGDDPLVEKYMDLATGERRGVMAWFAKRKPKSLGFDHLILHSDCEGLYLPLDFPDVLFGSESMEIPGEMLGSSQQLLAECKRIAQAIGIPEGIEHDAPELADAAEKQGQGTDWRRYGIESFVCVGLIAAAQHSISTRAAIVFC